MKNLNKILVATTLDVASDPVVAAGRDLARATGAELHLLHAYALPAIYYGSPMGMATVQPQALEGEPERLEHRLQEQLRRLDIADAAVASRRVEVGTAHRLLVEAVRELQVDLLLIGASETGGALAPLLGSTADRVLRKSSVPVLVVRGPLELPPRRLLAPTDLSELCQESLRHGLRLLEEVTRGASPDLRTLFVVSQAERLGSLQFSAEQVDSLARDELEKATAWLAGDGGWKARSRLRCGLARHEILAELEAEPADVVVVGTHGRSGFERLLMGSVAADVVRKAATHVLVVPPMPARQERGETVDEALAHRAMPRSEAGAMEAGAGAMEAEHFLG